MKIKNINHLSVVLTKLEGKKSQIKHGDMKEAVGKLSDLIYKNSTRWIHIHRSAKDRVQYNSKLIDLLYANGERRYKNSYKKSKKK